MVDETEFEIMGADHESRLNDSKGCEYCDGSGKVEMDNNGPIVDCPVCEGDE